MPQTHVYAHNFLFDAMHNLYIVFSVVCYLQQRVVMQLFNFNIIHLTYLTKHWYIPTES